MNNDEIELWKPITGWQGYEISNFGRARSVKFGKEKVLKFKLKWKRRKDRIEKKPNGAYLYLMLRNSNGKKKELAVHRLVALHFISNPNNKPEVNHIDGIKANCRVSNLEWSTRIENVDHSVNNKLHAFGESNGNSKLTDKTVMEIKELLAEGKLLQKDIAKLYRVDSGLISHIKLGKSWKHIVPLIVP